MRSRRSIIAGLVLVLSPGLAVADVLEIPLALSAPGPGDSFITVEFALGIPPADVTEVALILEGTYHEVELMEAFSPIDIIHLPGYFDTYLGDDVAEEPFVSVHHQFPAGSGTFSITQVLLSGEPELWPCLDDGVSTIGLEYGPLYAYGEDANYYVGYYSAISSFGELESARLVVTHGPLVGMERRTWGALKSLYR